MKTSQCEPLLVCSSSSILALTGLSIDVKLCAEAVRRRTVSIVARPVVTQHVVWERLGEVSVEWSRTMEIVWHTAEHCAFVSPVVWRLAFRFMAHTASWNHKVLCFS